MEQMNTILAPYAVVPLETEQVTESLWRIEDGRRTYALKKSSLDIQTVRTWENVLHEANSRHIPNILPVYLTGEHSLYTTAEGVIYYLTPWVQTDEVSIDHLYHCLGSIHAKTKESYQPGKESKEAFLTYKNHSKKTDEKLLQHVEQFETKRYMSPYELQVCMQYRDLELAGRKRQEKIDQFLEALDGQDEQDMWNYSLCNGSVQFSHILHGDRTYLINWENARYCNAVYDLIHFFTMETAVYDAPVKEMIDRFEVYMRKNELTKSELYLLTIHLLDPAGYMACIDSYQTARQPITEQIQHLMRAYRRVLFGLHWSNYVEETYETLELDELESSN